MSRRFGGFGTRRPGARPGSGVRGASDPFADHATVLPESAIGVSTMGLTLADGDTTVDAWASSFGGVSATLTAIASANRPAYDATGGEGGRPKIVFDGANDVMLSEAITKGSAWTDFEIGFVGEVQATGSGTDHIIGYANSASVATTYFRIESGASAGIMQATAGGTGGATSTFTTAEGTRSHRSFDWDGADQNVRTTGEIEDTDESTNTGYPDGLSICAGARPDGLIATGVTLMAWYFGPCLTDEQRTYLRALLTQHTGVAA